MNTKLKWVGAGLFCIMVAATGCGTPEAASQNTIPPATSPQPSGNNTATSDNGTQNSVDSINNQSGSGDGTNQTMTNYTNDRFGFSVLVPATFEQAPPSQDGDGQTWYAEGTAVKIQAFGEYNVTQNTVQSELAALSSSMKPTYHETGKDWLVVTGYSGSNIVYDKVYVGATNLYELQIEYPKSEQKVYGSVVDAVSSSFQPGSMS